MLSGRVTDEQGIPMPGANIIDSKRFSGVISDSEGYFNLSIKSLPAYIEVSFIGFTTQRFDNPTITNNKIELGTVSISEDSQQLDATMDVEAKWI